MTGTVRWFGDTALLVEVENNANAHRLVRALEDAMRPDRRQTGPAAALNSDNPRNSEIPRGIGDISIGMCSVVVHVDPGSVDPVTVESWLAELATTGSAGVLPGTAAPARPPGEAKRFDIPTTFEGPDLDGVATSLGTTPAGVVAMLTGSDLRVAFIGFAPGFPYLVGLPGQLAGIPRRASPRTSVPAGSVAVAGGFAGIYPSASPGGWMLLGRTDMPLFDVESEPFALLRAGDSVRFVPDHRSARSSGGVPTTDVPTTDRPLLEAGSDPCLEVVDPGFLTLVEDSGRVGVAAIGVPTAGAADPDAFRLANRLVGNDDDAACLEITAVGPVLRCSDDTFAALIVDDHGIGVTRAAQPEPRADIRLDGVPVPSNAVVPVAAGQTIAVGAVHEALRAYLAFAGGLRLPPVLGSMSSDVLTGIGPGPLRAGDCIGLGRPERPHGRLVASLGGSDGPGRPTAPGLRVPRVVRVIAGPHEFPPTEVAALVGRVWSVGTDSNRIGLRLAPLGAENGLVPPSTGVPSCGMVTGAVQVPPDGRPIVLMPDHATVGGYPVIACVISADLGVLGQLRAGDHVRFAIVDRAEAAAIRSVHDRGLGQRVSGWYPTRSGT